LGVLTVARINATSARLNLSAIARLATRVEGVSEAAIRKADKRAIANVRRRFEPAAKRAVRKVYNVRAGDLAGKFQIRTGADGDGEYMALHASPRKLPLIMFGGRWGGRKTKGATAQIQRGGRKVYASSFIAMIGGQRRLVVRQYARDSTAASGRDPRNKLRSLTGASPWQMVMGEGEVVASALAREMTQYRRDELLRQLQLSRKGKI
jgi:hypothetical protein